MLNTSAKVNTIGEQEIFGKSDAHLVSEPLLENHRLEKDTTNAFLAMQMTAHQAGIDLQICSSFRSFDKQLSIWNRKWLGELAILDADSQTLAASNLSDLEKIHAIMRWSALPGASRHHWGTDFDIYDAQSVRDCGHKLELVPSEYEPLGPCYKLNEWMDANAADFGFFRPYTEYNGGVAQEPWHFSFADSASKVMENFNLDALYTLISKTDIQGKHAILSTLPALYKRYTLNEGTQL